MKTKNIVLTGPPGSGKSAVGQFLAAQLDAVFVDMDQEIEKEINCSIPEFFASAGEEAFRDVESTICKKLSKKDGLVIATGGGVLLREQNRTALKSCGTMINLNVSYDELMVRLKGCQNRPLLKDDTQGLKLKKLIEERRVLYEMVSIQVNTDNISPQEVAQKIEELLDNKGAKK